MQLTSGVVVWPAILMNRLATGQKNEVGIKTSLHRYAMILDLEPSDQEIRAVCAFILEMRKTEQVLIEPTKMNVSEIDDLN